MTEDLELEKPKFDRALGPVEGVAIVVGTVIGSGIFVTPSAIAQTAGSHGFGVILAVWVVCGLLSLAGALTYAELAAMFPSAGGQYVFLREAYGPKWAFLFGWMEFWVARAGSIATIAVGFAIYAGYFTHLDGDWGIRWTAFLVIFILTLVNYLGVRWGGAVQVLFTGTKVASLLTLGVCAFALPGGRAENWQPLLRPDAAPGAGALFAAIGAGMIHALWAYDGWANGAAVAEEIKDPQRNVPRALAIGTATVMAIYLLVNLAYHYVLPMEQVVRTDRVAVATAETLFEGGRIDTTSGAEDPEGRWAAALVAAAVMISTFGAINGTLLTGPRIFFAMARDRLFFREMGDLHLRFRSPFYAIFFQGLWASFLVLMPFNEIARWAVERKLWPLDAAFLWLLGGNLETRLFDQLLTFVIFASWLFYGMAVAGVFVLRRRRPDLPRPYRVWGYPWVPLLFVLTSAAFVLQTLFTQRAESIAGLVIVAAGLPAYHWWSRRRA